MTNSPGHEAHARRIVADRLRQAKAIAVVRLPSSERLPEVVVALVAGGLSAIELTLTTPGALAMFETLATRFGDAIVLGAGSVRGAGSAREAIDAGARFLVTPVGDREVLEVGHTHHCPVALGAFTPTEMVAVHNAGADFVKLFPADLVGPGYVRSVLAPLPHLPIMPTGGVTPANVGDWIAAGCVAVGLGSSLVDAASVARGDWAVLEERARQITAAVNAAHANAVSANAASANASTRSH